MLEVSSQRKNKINLADYNYQQDIDCRMIIADFSPFDLSLLEEILFSPLKISRKKLARTLSVEEVELFSILDKLSSVGLLTVEDDCITVDKEMRKYFEFQIQRFDPDFKPDLEFLQGLLRRIPVHILPTWYSISRSSNNVFESIVEKHLVTPQVFQRHLNELNITDPLMLAVMKDVFAADLRISSSDLISKYNLSRPDFEKMMLHFEFSFICSLRYIKEDDHWHEIVTPFHEWSEYLKFLKDTHCPVIATPDLIVKQRQEDYAFVEDVTTVLHSLQKNPPAITPQSLQEELPLSLAALCQFPLETPENCRAANAYFSRLIAKISLLKLVESIDGRLYPVEAANEWLSMTTENKALFFYRHPLNRILSTFATDLPIDRPVREAEKAVKRILHGGWVLFDDFIKGVYVPLNDESTVMLKKTGKQWQYTLPAYSEAEKNLIKATLFDWLFECGITTIGTFKGKDCFALTPFGRFFFAD